MNRTVQIVLGIILLVAVAAGGFYGGTVYGRGQAQALLTTTGQQGALAAFGQGGGGPALDPGQAAAGAAGRRQGAQGTQGGMILGQIEEIKAGAMIVVDADGKQTEVRVTDTTLIEKNASVTLADLKPGETVMVTGTQDSNGSVTARSVQVGVAGRLGGLAPGGAQ